MTKQKNENLDSEVTRQVDVDDPAANFDDAQAFKIFRVERVDGRSSLAYLDTIYGFDEETVKERFGGGKYQIRPIDKSRRFISGSFTVDISASANPDSAPTPGDDLRHVEAGDPLLEYLIGQNKALQAKLEGMSNPASVTNDFSPESMQAMVNAILQKKMVIKAMKPLFDALDDGEKKSDLDMMKMFKMFTDILKEGVNLGQGVEYKEPQDKGVVGIIERFLPQLFQVLSAKKTAPAPDTQVYRPMLPDNIIAQPGPDDVVPDDNASQSDVYMFELPQKIERAIMALVRCLESELDLTDSQIVDDYLKPILRPRDIKVIGPNLTYDNIISILTERALSEEKLVLAENETRVKAIIDLMVNVPPGSDADSQPGKADSQSRGG